MTKAKIYVRLKPSVLDPQGKAVTNSLHALGYDTIRDTRVSKYIEVVFDEEISAALSQKVNSICDKLLANLNTESYSFELEKME
jgi:phosphoribosylformylglycinamidine synthase